MTTEEELKNLSVAEKYELNQNLLDSSVEDRPLINSVSPISEIRSEYLNGNPKFLKQIDDLAARGYTHVRRAKGDGDCFYRSLAFAYIDKLLAIPQDSREIAVASVLSFLTATQERLSIAGFDKMIYEDPFEALQALLYTIVDPNKDDKTKHGTILKTFQDPEQSNMIVFYLRLLTSAELQTGEDEYAAFLENPEVGGEISPRDYCNRFVETLGKEAEHVSMLALARALQADISIAYLDGRDETISFLQLPDPPLDKTAKPLRLLYRPGHYDILLRSDDG